ncbi:MAG: molybdopterin-dependent oxidoreductase [Lachnospiraceae bacterium]|nr:molybdopterin-dependent oxidoreductase [Lachnospiraceae bacterium]
MRTRNIWRGFLALTLAAALSGACACAPQGTAGAPQTTAQAGAAESETAKDVAVEESTAAGTAQSEEIAQTTTVDAAEAGNETTGDGAAAPEGETVPADETQGAEEPYPGYSVIEGMYEAMDQRAEEYAPQIITLESGVQVQRTPSEQFAGVYHNPGNTISYNTYYLHADERGCAACHPDMNATLANMEYRHVDLNNSLGIQTTVAQCLDCHTYSPGYVTEFYGFGTLIHGIHDNDAFTGSCQSCHNMTGDGNGIQLWDNVKHHVLRGIVDVAEPESVQAEFSWNQDVTVAADDIFYFNWMYYDYDYPRYAASEAGIEGDPALFDSWPVSVSGAVETPFETTLSELIAEAPTIERVMTMHCTINPTGGPLIANSQIKAIPLSWLLEKAGIRSDATVILPTANDGFTIPVKMSHLQTFEAYLVYEIDGKRLSIEHGYPLQLWVGGGSAAECIKQLTEIVVMDDNPDDYYMYLGWETEEGGYANKPNVGICYTQEGQIIELGKPFTFEGYAQAFDKQITAVEISLDRGKSWTRYDVSDSATDQWVYWYYTFTPQEPGAYVLTARSISEDGLVTEDPVELMVNAR